MNPITGAFCLMFVLASAGWLMEQRDKNAANSRTAPAVERRNTVGWNANRQPEGSAGMTPSLETPPKSAVWILDGRFPILDHPERIHKILTRLCDNSHNVRPPIITDRTYPDMARRILEIAQIAQPGDLFNLSMGIDYHINELRILTQNPNLDGPNLHQNRSAIVNALAESSDSNFQAVYKVIEALNTLANKGVRVFVSGGNCGGYPCPDETHRGENQFVNLLALADNVNVVGHDDPWFNWPHENNTLINVTGDADERGPEDLRGTSGATSRALGRRYCTPPLHFQGKRSVALMA